MDILVKVTSKSEFNNNITFYIEDDTDKTTLTIGKYFNFINVKDLIRIRGVYEGEDQQLYSYVTSNIISIPKSTYIYADYDYRLYINKKEQLLSKKHQSIADELKENVVVNEIHNLNLNGAIKLFKEKKLNSAKYLVNKENLKKTLKFEYLPEFNIEKIESLQELHECVKSIYNIKKNAISNLNISNKIKIDFNESLTIKENDRSNELLGKKIKSENYANNSNNYDEDDELEYNEKKVQSKNKKLVNPIELNITKGDKDIDYLSLRESLFNTKEEIVTKRLLLDVFILKIEPSNYEDGIRKGCRRTSCLYEEFNDKVYTCKNCGWDLTYFYNFDFYLQLLPNSLEILKVKYNTLKELEGEGLISINSNIAKRNIPSLYKCLESLKSNLTFNTLCLELPDWKIIGKYSSLI